MKPYELIIPAAVFVVMICLAVAFMIKPDFPDDIKFGAIDRSKVSDSRGTNSESGVADTEPKPDANIIVESPKPYDEIGLPLRISGRARVSENQLVYRLRDGRGNILIRGHIYAHNPDAGHLGPFEVFEINVYYPEPKDEYGALEVFDYSAEDGSETDTVIIPLAFKPVESSTVKVFFLNDKLDPEITCEKAFPVERRIPKGVDAMRIALDELLKGPTMDDIAAGYFTNINQGVNINKLTIERGIAKADFDDTLQYHVGGSCRVTAIRAQITLTLMQFPHVENVIISINGRTEDILQP